MDCLFCKIIAGEIPAYKVYEDENVFAFLDINPKEVGHTLVIPKNHTRNIFTLEETSGLMESVVKVSNLLKSKLECEGLNIYVNNEAIAGQEVFHLHFHLVPAYENSIHLEKDEFTKIIEKINA